MTQIDPKTVDFWYKELGGHPLVHEGMTKDIEQRREFFKTRELPPVFSQFDAVTKETYNFDAPELGNVLLDTLKDVPEGVQTVLHNFGVTHFVTQGETEYVFGQEDTSYQESGRYFSHLHSAVTEAVDYFLPDIFRHEAGHALSDALGNQHLFFQKLVDASVKDIGNLTEEEWSFLSKSTIPNIYNNGIPSNKHIFSDPQMLRERFEYDLYFTTVELGHTLRVSPNEIQALFPNVIAVYGPNGYDSPPPVVYSNISDHPRIQAAYHKDFNALLEGNGPNNTRLEYDENAGEANIVDANGHIVMDVSHYVGRDFGGDTNSPVEEAFAEIYDNITGPYGIVPDRIYDLPDLAAHFPNLATEVIGCVAALEKYVGNDPEQTLKSAPADPVSGFIRLVDDSTKQKIANAALTDFDNITPPQWDFLQNNAKNPLLLFLSMTNEETRIKTFEFIENDPELTVHGLAHILTTDPDIAELYFPHLVEALTDAKNPYEQTAVEPSEGLSTVHPYDSSVTHHHYTQ